jgi:hypothetical protein
MVSGLAPPLRPGCERFNLAGCSVEQYDDQFQGWQRVPFVLPFCNTSVNRGERVRVHEIRDPASDELVGRLSRHLPHQGFVDIYVATVQVHTDRQGTVVHQPPVPLCGLVGFRLLSRGSQIPTMPDDRLFADLIFQAPRQPYLCRTVIAE